MSNFLAALGRHRFHYLDVFMYQVLVVLLTKGLYWQAGVAWVLTIAVSIVATALTKVIDEEQTGRPDR